MPKTTPKRRTKKQLLKDYGDFVQTVCTMISEAAAHAAQRWILENPTSRGPITPVPGMTQSLKEIDSGRLHSPPIEAEKDQALRRMKIVYHGKCVFDAPVLTSMRGHEFKPVRCELGEWIIKLIEYAEGKPRELTRRLAHKRALKGARNG